MLPSHNCSSTQHQTQLYTSENHTKTLPVVYSFTTATSTANQESTGETVITALIKFRSHCNIDQQTLQAMNLALADSASATSSTTSTVTTDMQPPTASLLGLPAELLNYTITLVVLAEKSKPDLRTFLLAQRQQASIEPKGTFRAYPTPALAGTCTSLEAIVLPIYYGRNPPIFCSPKLAYDWLSTRRKGRSEAAVRRVWIHFEVTRKISEGPGWKQAALEMLLVSKTDALAISETSPFCVGACRECQRRLQSEIQQINDRASGFKFGHERLAALADYFDTRGRVLGFPDGCIICGKHQRNALIGDKQGFAELLRAISWS